MAEQDSTNGGNGSMQPADEPQVAILAQYIKDFRSKIRARRRSFNGRSSRSSTSSSTSLSIRSPTTSTRSCSRSKSSARSDNGVHFVIDLSYAGLFGSATARRRRFRPFLLIEAPRLLFPFARQIIADAVSNTGFPPLLLDPIDFTAAYMAQLQAAEQQQAGEQPADGETTPPQEEPQPQ